MNPLERGHVHESRGVAEQHDPVSRAARGQRVEAAFGDRLRAPLDHLPTLEDAPEQRVELHALKQGLNVEVGVRVVEPHDQP